MEVRKVDGTRYPPASIHLLLCGLQRYMCRTNDSFVTIFDKNDVRFRGLHGTMEAVFQSLHQEGIRAEVQLISGEEEDRLWALGILGDGSPKSLWVFFEW